MWFGRKDCKIAGRLLATLALVVAVSLSLTAARAGPREECAALLQRGAQYYEKGDYAKAVELLERASKLGERAFGQNSLNVGVISNNLALAYNAQGRYAEAETLYKRARAIDEKALGPDHPDVAASLNNLAVLYRHQGRYAEAESLYKRALAIEEKALGPDHPHVAHGLNNLANVYDTQGRYAEAEPLHKRALAIREKALGPDHPDVAQSLLNLALVYSDQGRYAEAEPLYKRALAIREKALGPDHPQVAANLIGLALLYRHQGRYAEAEPLHRRALAIEEKALGPDHPEVAANLTGLATLYWDQGRYAEVEPPYKRALAIREKALGPDHPDVAQSLNNLAFLYEHDGRNAQALDASRRAVAILIRRIAQTTDKSSDGSTGERQKTRGYFLQLVHLLSQLSVNGTSPSPAIVDEAFRAAQYAGGIETSQALTGMTARYAAGSDALAALVRERQDLAARWQKLDADVVKAVSQPPDKRNSTAEAGLRQELAEVAAKLKAADDRLRAEFPRYAELAAAKPVGVTDIQSVLGPDEAFAALTLADKESYLFLIRKDGAHVFRLDITRAKAGEAVQALRKTLIDYQTAFDTAKAHDLYKNLLGPADSLIADARHLILVPDGALQSLPPTVLVTAPPSDVSKSSDYKPAAWLIRRQAVTVLPAASSLVALHRFAEARQAKDPFIGFGDPDFRGDRGAGGISTASLYRGGEANLDGLQHLPRLEETAGELRAEAKALGAPDSSVHLGPEATVTLVRRLALANARVVSFATHGLIAGDLPQLAEPALVLTPPANPTPEDDGLLRASQVSQLKLNADFVILSACNTAAPDGKPGAEGLSGLAKAFFYAGARSLLVSHWPVDSDATVKLTTGLIRATAEDPSIGRAEALRRSILAMIDNAPANSNDAHPALWAPFILAGEGGAKK
jgi:CHAT domain-containing protein/Tfp pilus assembly protein PilF